jgi:hypothetical protein
MDVTLNWEAFIFVLACLSCLSSYNPLSMVYEVLQDYFVPDDFLNDFQFFLMYVGTLFMVMFPHLYHICL